jgi:hypothetical protein
VLKLFCFVIIQYIEVQQNDRELSTTRLQLTYLTHARKYDTPNPNEETAISSTLTTAEQNALTLLVTCMQNSRRPSLKFHTGQEQATGTPAGRCFKEGVKLSISLIQEMLTADRKVKHAYRDRYRLACMLESEKEMIR